MHNLEQALISRDVPVDVVNIILNLAEFMEHDEKAFTIESRLLGDYVGPGPIWYESRDIAHPKLGRCFPRLRQSSALQGIGVLRRRLGVCCGGSHQYKSKAATE